MIFFHKRINIKVCHCYDWCFFILCQLCQIRLCLWNFFYFFLFFCFWSCFFSALMGSTVFLRTTSLAIRSLGGSKAVTSEMVAGWNETTLPTLLSNYDLENIYNADEFALFYQCLPHDSYQLKREKSSSGKNSKIRISGLGAGNAVGNKLPLWLLLVKQKIQGVLKTLRNYSVDIDHKERAGWIVFYLKNGLEM